MAQDRRDTELLKAVGARVKAARTARALNQDDFAAAAQVHRAYIGQIENGRKDLRLSTLYRLAAALGVPVCELLPDGPRTDSG